MTERFTLIAGWPASRFQMVGFIGLWLGFGGLGLSFSSIYAHFPGWSVVALCALTVLSLTAMVVFLTLGHRAGQREAAAGYATAFRPVNLDVPQVDPATGLVIRQAGTDPLSWPVRYNAAKRQAILKAESYSRSVHDPTNQGAEMTEWYYNFKTKQVEEGPQSLKSDRDGPFATREEAARAPEIIAERARNWAAEDAADK